jgi:hypothetical protein
MICCAIVGLVMVALAACRGFVKGSVSRLSRARWALIALVAGLMLAGGAAWATSRRAHQGQSELAAMLLLHFCGKPPASPAV